MTSPPAPKRRRRLAATVIGLVLVVAALKAPAYWTPVYEGDLSDHFDGRLFSNIPAEQTVRKSLVEVLRWRLTREPGPWVHKEDIVYYTPPAIVDTGIRVTFVNHATVLIQTDGVNILTDPIWSRRTSPVGWAGPERYRDPGIRFADLPQIDAVLISHNHYDHMDMDSLVDLSETHNPEFLVPLGNARYLQRAGISNIAELDWWQTVNIAGVDIHAVPAQHWSRRGLYDTNRALWSGYVIVSTTGPVYFAGDTGMGSHFAEISSRFGAPRLALLPIGAYLPRWFMAKQHVNPEEVVSAHILMGAQTSMAIHFGTFQLGDDGQDEPTGDLRLAMDAAGVPGQQFWIPGNGDSRLFE